LTYCFEELTLKICEFEEYRTKIIEYLLDNCILHWNATIRKLSSITLGKLAALYKGEFSMECLTKLVMLQLNKIEIYNISDIHTNGALIALGKILYGLAQNEGFWHTLDFQMTLV
jgi:hypothetical protein